VKLEDRKNFKGEGGREKVEIATTCRGRGVTGRRGRQVCKKGEETASWSGNYKTTFTEWASQELRIKTVA